METKESENTNTNPIRVNSEKGVERLYMKFEGNKYDTQLTRTGNKRKYFMHGMWKLAADVKFKQMTHKKGIKNNGERES